MKVKARESNLQARERHARDRARESPEKKSARLPLKRAAGYRACLKRRPPAPVIDIRSAILVALFRIDRAYHTLNRGTS
jgi:hypothetical protein